MRRLQHIAGHIHGHEAERPLWVRIMDGAGPAAPRAGCRCTAEKWRFVCRCYQCLEHAGRVNDFDWTPELLAAPQSSASRPLLLLPVSTSSGGGGQDPATETLGGVSRLTSSDGRVIGPMSPAQHPRFSGIATFARLPHLNDLVSLQEARAGVLRVRALAGHRLLNRDSGVLGDVSDPYVVARIGGAQERTPVSNSLNPVWGCELSLPVVPQDGLLELEVMNANIDSSLGRTAVGLWSLPLSRWHRVRTPLEEGQGELEFEVRLDRSQPLVDVAVLGVPFDSGCSFRPGARFGPESVRANSRLIRPYMIALQQRPLIERQVVDAGDVAVTPFGIDLATAQILEGCREKLRLARRLVLVGGDHTLSYPAIKAVAEKFGPVVLIHFDSHLDTFPPMYGQDVWHGSPFRKCWEEGLLAKDGSTHIGIRATTYSPQDFVDSEAMGIATLTAEDVHERGVPECLEVVHRRYGLSGGAPVYLSIDIDVLDPSVAPGTGTPEFGGLLAHQLLRFVRGLQGLPIVGADVVEVAPAYDHAGITAMAAANLLLEEIALINSTMDVDGF